MNPAEKVQRIIAGHRESAKFVHVQHSSEFIDDLADLGAGFYSAHFYDEKVDSTMLLTKYGPVIAANSYISSFAYNLLLVWIYVGKSDLDLGARRRLLEINLRKFFAEQVYRRANRVPSRCLLLQTLLYESEEMRPLFEVLASDAKLESLVTAGEAIMSLSLTIHELGHFQLETKEQFWNRLCAERPDLGTYFEAEASKHPANLDEELKCDAIAITGCFRQWQTSMGAEFTLRAIVFGYAAYSAMYSAVATADSTGSLWEQRYDDVVDMRNIEPMPHVDHEIVWKLDAEFVLRARFVEGFCRRMATDFGVELFGDDRPFPMPKSIIDDMLKLVEHVFDSPSSGANRMSNLLAQAFCGHKEGIEYVYLRSKTFKTNRTEPLRL